MMVANVIKRVDCAGNSMTDEQLTRGFRFLGGAGREHHKKEGVIQFVGNVTEVLSSSSASLGDCSPLHLAV